MVPTESGHADFSPRGDLQRDLAQFIANSDNEAINGDHRGICEVEDVLCGKVKTRRLL